MSLEVEPVMWETGVGPLGGDLNRDGEGGEKDQGSWVWEMTSRGLGHQRSVLSGCGSLGGGCQGRGVPRLV